MVRETLTALRHLITRSSASLSCPSAHRSTTSASRRPKAPGRHLQKPLSLFFSRRNCESIRVHARHIGLAFLYPIDPRAVGATMTHLPHHVFVAHSTSLDGSADPQGDLKVNHVADTTLWKPFNRSTKVDFDTPFVDVVHRRSSSTTCLYTRRPPTSPSVGLRL